MFELIIGICFIIFVLCIGIGLLQEKMFFHPSKVDPTYQYTFPNAQDLYIKMPDDIILHGLLFKTTIASPSKGCIFYLHGNAGSLTSWGFVSDIYTSLEYDIFMLDYRGYGKSQGYIKSEEQCHSDVQCAYDRIKRIYNENNITILGYSIGTGFATRLASKNHPKQLILQAPFTSLTRLKSIYAPYIPDFILRYKFDNLNTIKNITVPICIFHGNADSMIPYTCSIELYKQCKPNDKLILLKNVDHVPDSIEYKQELKNII